MVVIIFEWWLILGISEGLRNGRQSVLVGRATLELRPGELLRDRLNPDVALQINGPDSLSRDAIKT